MNNKIIKDIDNKVKFKREENQLKLPIKVGIAEVIVMFWTINDPPSLLELIQPFQALNPSTISSASIFLKFDQELNPVVPSLFCSVAPNQCVIFSMVPFSICNFLDLIAINYVYAKEHTYKIHYDLNSVFK